MKQLLTFLACLIFANFALGQNEKSAYKAVTDSFVSNFNANNFEVIFSGFAPEMQKALPIEKTKEFLTGLKQQAGKIIQREFVKYEQTYASYKTTFERAVLTVNISIDSNSEINGLFVKPYQESTLPKMDRNKTKLILPFNEVWTVIWGGDTKELNYHVVSEAQKNAFDWVIIDEKGNSYRTDGKTNQDYYAFEKELFAPCDGEIVFVVDGVKDNSPGVLNPLFAAGNAVMIKTDLDEYLFFAHFRKNSIAVKEGQRVKQGQLLGLCGNSGNSTEAHLHFHIQNAEETNSATGVKCYFDKIMVDGKERVDYSPIQREHIRNVSR